MKLRIKKLELTEVKYKDTHDLGGLVRFVEKPASLKIILEDDSVIEGEFVVPEEFILQDVRDLDLPKCTCATLLLMQSDCQCGQVRREKERA